LEVTLADKKTLQSEKRYECSCGETFGSEEELRKHTHPAKKRAATVSAQIDAKQKRSDAQRPREQGQTEEERHEWLRTNDSSPKKDTR
jgi:hypothetical protein